MTNNNALAIYDDGGFEVMQRSAKAMVASGFFKDANDVAKATVKVMAGAELGIAPFASMTGIHIISGKPTLSSNLIATLVKNDPRYNYQVKVSTDTICTLVWFEGGNRTGESSFTIDEAKTAGLTRNPTWKSYPSDMLFARALTRGTRRFAPGVFGGAPVYTPDEMGANYDPVSDIVWEGKSEPTSIGIEPETGEIVDDAPQTAVVEIEARTAEETAAALMTAAESNTKDASEGQLKYMRSSLSKAVNGDKLKAGAVLDYAFAIESSAAATGGMASAIIEWVGSTADSNWEPLPASKQEAERMYTAYMARQGQETLL